MGFKLNDVVRVVRCACCEGVVGKTGRVRAFEEEVAPGTSKVSISFGKGRPQKGRPEFFPVEDLSLVTD